jgi:hypothetical protein
LTKKTRYLKVIYPRNKGPSNENGSLKKELKTFNKHLLKKRRIKKMEVKKEFFGYNFRMPLIIITSFPIQENISFLIRVLINISHPAGWFFLWEGLGKILLTSKEKKPTFNFYKKMSKCSVEFSYY